MKKNSKKIALIGLAASVVFGTSACGPPEEMTGDITEEDNVLEDVYGPPEDLNWGEDGDN